MQQHKRIPRHYKALMAMIQQQSSQYITGQGTRERLCS